MYDAFEGLYAPLRDVTGYLERIGIRESIAPNRENLDRLVYAHLTHVPYENLVYCIEHKVPDLTTEGLYEKIVMDHRGGYCFELNGLFFTLLQALGYQVYPVACRMRLGDFHPIGHRATIVTIDGAKFFVDVGASGAAGLYALPYDGITAAGYYITRSNQATEVRKKEGDTDKLLITYMDYPFEPVDFIPLNYYTSEGPAGQERCNPIVNLTTEHGAISIDNHTFKRRVDGVETTVTIETEEQFYRLLREEFGIVLRLA